MLTSSGQYFNSDVSMITRLEYKGKEKGKVKKED